MYEDWGLQKHVGDGNREGSHIIICCCLPHLPAEVVKYFGQRQYPSEEASLPRLQRKISIEFSCCMGEGLCVCLLVGKARRNKTLWTGFLPHPHNSLGKGPGFLDLRYVVYPPPHFFPLLLRFLPSAPPPAYLL